VLPTLGIKVTVLEVRGDKVRLGFEAPRDVPIHREEIHEKICRAVGLPSEGS
jgi:carbon storage regulator